MRTCLMPLASVVLTIPKTAIGSEKRNGGKAFVQGVMEGMMALSQDGRGPADRGFAIDFPFIVTP